MIHKVVITSVGSLVGHNVLDSLAGRRTGLSIIGTNSLAEAPGNYRCDKAYLVPPANEHIAYRTRLKEIFSDEEPGLVIPARDEDIIILSELARAYPELATRLLVGSLEMARIMDDKIASYNFARKWELPFVETLDSDALDAQRQLTNFKSRYGFPMIAKPRAGNGSRGIRILMNETHLDQAVQETGFAIQPMIDPPVELHLDTSAGLPFFWEATERSLYAFQALIDKTGSIKMGIGVIGVMVSGRCEKMVRCNEPQLLKTAERYAEIVAQQGWRGPFNIQFKKDPIIGYLAIEMNGRFTGGTSARRYLGFDEVAECLNSWLGETVVPVLKVAPEENYSVIKNLSDLTVPAAGYQALTTKGVWQ